ncbi:MAG: hypothetical protein M1826_003945 [Phylliscum demangeonii]|nr:MAG: hypothetical protein M1826_003945 [Phylliscum demangeonii]
MVNPLKTIAAFIEGIPDQAFFRGMSGTWHKDFTAAGPDQAYNIQVQVNREHVDPALKQYSPNTVAKALIPVNGDTTPDQIRQALIDGIIPRGFDAGQTPLAAVNPNPLKTITAFIEGIPDQAFFRGRTGSWHKDVNLRLDMQGLTATGPDQAYNIQVQVNRKHVDRALDE